LVGAKYGGPDVMTFFDAHQVAVQGTFIYLLLALSVQVPLRMGIFSFAGVGFFAVGAYVTGIVVLNLQLNTFLAIGVGALASALVGLLLASVLQRLNGLYLGMATVAFDLIVSTVAVNGGSLTGGSTGLYGVLPQPMLTIQYIFVIAVVAVVAVALTERGRLGRRIDAIREDAQLAAALGIRVTRCRVAAFVASAVLGGVAGGVYISVRTTVSPETVGFGLVVLALTMIIVGGTRSWLGAAIGAVVFTWLPEILVSTAEWRPIIYGTIVVLAAIWVPGGVVGVWTDGWRAIRNRRQRRQVDAATRQLDTDTDPAERQLREASAQPAGRPRR
jgi:branched-chain amino acid transport system permease protein